MNKKYLLNKENINLKKLGFLMVFALLITACSKSTLEDVGIDDDPTEEVIPKLPHLYINTEGEAPITTKEDYISAELKIDGFEAYDDFEVTTGIRGRGNSTWNMPKKPYRLKLESSEPLMGLKSYKNWILLNEYLDGSMLYNSIPYKAGELLEMPYVNHIIPVQLTINGAFQGVYAFSEHKEVKQERIDIGDDGWLLEMDVYFDEDLQFVSDFYELPIMIQFPKYKDMTESEAQQVLSEVKSDFGQLESLVYDESFPNNNYLDYFDDMAWVNYMIVYELTLNRELNHPKSTYIHKKKDGKFRMGIIWDFDWAFGYQITGQHFDMSTADTPLFIENSSTVGTHFFSRFYEDPHNKSLFKDRWNWFRAHKYSDLKDYIKTYAEQVRQGYDQDHEIWGLRTSSGDLDQDLQNLLQWLEARANYIDQQTQTW